MKKRYLALVRGKLEAEQLIRREGTTSTLGSLALLLVVAALLIGVDGARAIFGGGSLTVGNWPSRYSCARRRASSICLAVR